MATSGWTLDEQGRALSKSLGNGVDPVDIAERLGGEIVRLWVASVDFREDVSASENIMQRVADNYRKLRNTFRFLLGNLHDFDPAQDAVAWDKLEPLDQYMLTRARELTDEGPWPGTSEFEFHRIYHAVNEFAIVDLSSLYMDVLKDRLYTFAPNSRERRAAQTVLWRITEALARLVAPILSFLADEVWQYLPADAKRECEHPHRALPCRRRACAKRLTASDSRVDLDFLLRIRDMVLTKLERTGNRKRSEKALEAKVQITLRAESLAYLRENRVSLKELYNVSQVDSHSRFADIRSGAYEHFFASGPIADEDFATIVQVATFPADGTNARAAGTTARMSASIRAGPRSAAAAPARSTRLAFRR